MPRNVKKCLTFLATAMVSFIIGSFFTYVEKNQILPFWNSIYMKFGGKPYCYIVGKGRTVGEFAKEMTDNMAQPGMSNYAVLYTPGAENIEIAATAYEPQKTWSDIVKHVVSRNGCNISYWENKDPKYKFIKIYACGEEPKEKSFRKE